MNFRETAFPFGNYQECPPLRDITLWPDGAAHLGNRRFPDRSMIEEHEFAPGCRAHREAGTRLIRIHTADGEEYRLRYSAFKTKWYRQTPVTPTLQEQMANKDRPSQIPWSYYLTLDAQLLSFFKRWGWPILWWSAFLYIIVTE